MFREREPRLVTPLDHDESEDPDAGAERAERAERARWLLERLRSDDPRERNEAAVMLEEDYGRLVWHLIRKERLGEEASGGLYTDVWVALYDNRFTIRDAARLPAWFATTVRRRAQKMRRGVATESLDADAYPDLVAEGTDPVADAQLAELRIIVYGKIDQLDEPCRQLLLLWLDNRSIAYIAHALGRPVGSIGPMLGRCKKRLLELLGDGLEG